MPTEVRVLGATALLTAALVFIAWWLGQHHDALVQRFHGDETATVGALPRLELPSLSWSEEAPRALPTTSDAGFGVVPDAGDDDAMQGTEAELAAILIPAICNRRRECRCEEYPSRFAPEEERIDATTCEQDTLRDFRSWWRDNIRAPVVVVAEPLMTPMLRDLVSCSGFHGPISRFLLADAVVGESCASDTCRDGSPCLDGRCARLQQRGESCWMEGEGIPPEAAWNTYECARGLHCVAERCEVDPIYGHWISRQECRNGTFARLTDPPHVTVFECVATGTRCDDRSDCGAGHCVGAQRGERRCVYEQWSEFDPGDHALEDCGGGVPCPHGHACRFGNCQPVVGLGERCENAACGRLARCETLVPGGGECIAGLCLTSHFFREVADN